MKTLGFVGTGTIAKAFIEGLVASGKTNPIMLSPRSEAISTTLAQRHAHISRATSNAEVVAKSDIVFLGMRPPQVETALEGISFRPEQILCSFVAGLPIAELEKIVPNTKICRVLPLPAIEVCKGPVAHFPAVPDILDLLDGMGEVIVPREETELTAMGAVSGTMSTFMELQHTLAEWLTGKGAEPSTADRYVRAMFSGLSETALQSRLSLTELAKDHQTKGGLNERTRAHLKASGWFVDLTGAIDRVQQVKREDLD